MIAPASANTIAKLAGGHADNLLTSAALACTAPLVIAPAMNDAHVGPPGHARRTSRRCACAARRSSSPATGRLASKGEWGQGRLAEPAEILARDRGRGRWRRWVSLRGRLDGLRVLVTAGGTREPIDSVRYVGNRSSGRMGVALAEEAAARGADVTLIAANVALPSRPRACARSRSTTAAELEAAARAEFPHADVLLMAAAVADFRPGGRGRGQDQEGRPGRARSCRSRPTTGRARGAVGAARRPGQTLVGFAAEHGEGGAGARARKARAQGPRRGRAQRHLPPGDRLRRPSDNEVTIVTAVG